MHFDRRSPVSHAQDFQLEYVHQTYDAPLTPDSKFLIGNRPSMEEAKNLWKVGRILQ